VDFFAVLPPELALYVVSFLGHHELCMLARVCHLCRGLSYDDEVRPARPHTPHRTRVRTHAG
jgi:hypothetical protein